MDIYKKIIRPMLFRLEAETAHNMARALLRRPRLVQLFTRPDFAAGDSSLKVDLGGLTVPNPVGLSAGFDKDADMCDALSLFGFGYVVSGSIMCNVRPGNPKPRMVRDPDRKALFSCMGLPSKGLDYAVKSLRQRKNFQTPLVINFNAETYDEYVLAFDALQPFGDAMELSLYCPNRPADAGDFLEPNTARALLSDVLSRKQKPLFIKVPGYATEDDRRKRLALVEMLSDLDIDGVSITPASRVTEKRLSIGQGTVTGPPYYSQMMTVTKGFYRILGKSKAIKASGGVDTAGKAFDAIAAGASSVELYTAFFYQGWGITRAINSGLSELLKKHGITNMEELRGSGVSAGS